MDYKIGLERLEGVLPTGDVQRRDDFDNFKTRLLTNRETARRFGETPALSNEYYQIVSELNRLSWELAGMSFADLSTLAPNPPPSRRAPDPPRDEGRTRHEGIVSINQIATDLKSEDVNRVADMLARLAAPQQNPQAYLRFVVNRAKLPEEWKMEVAGRFHGNVVIDALDLVRWAISKGVNPAARGYTALGSILDELLRLKVGLDDAAMIAGIIRAYRLYRDPQLLADLELRYQMPVLNATDVAGPHNVGPDITWQGPTDETELQGFLQRPPDYQDVGFLMRAIKWAASICRVETPQRTGTGFLIANDLILTNYHVLRNNPAEDLEANARGTRVRFGYFTMEGGNAAQGREFALAFEHPVVGASPIDQLDYALLRVEGAIWRAEELHPVELAGELPRKHDGLNILQHPRDDTMKLATSRDGVVGVYEDCGLVQYVTPAATGSSGAPCFNDDWKVVALHHAQKARSFGSIREGILIGPIHSEIARFL